MAHEYRIGKIHYVDGAMHADINLSRFNRQFAAAQYHLGSMVLQDCKPYMPHLTGSLQQRSHVENNGATVVFPGPYASYLYGGVVMVDSATGRGPMKISTGPGGEYILRFKRGAKLVATARPLKYSSPTATSHWFDTAKAKHGAFWISETKRIGGGG